ncbi:MAG: GFA family protein, partial [Pseudomonadales bacterium]|nr:GFA family protein [Pseudomonadales bacterium]
MTEYDTEAVVTEGQCLCGDVRYRAEGDCFGLIHCHCRRCRKHTGASVVSYVVFAETARLQWISGKDKLVSFRGRAFCPVCGSGMPSSNGDDTKFGNVYAGNSLTMAPVKGHFYLYTGSRAPWTETPPPELPQWDTAIDPPEVEELDRYQEVGRITGSCLCGEVSYAAVNPLGMMNCHCTRCRLSRSAAHATNLFVNEDDFEWRAGEKLLRRYKLPEADRFGTAFCRACGSPMPLIGVQSSCR